MSSAVVSLSNERPTMPALEYDDMPEPNALEPSLSAPAAAAYFPEFHYNDSTRKFDASHVYHGESQQQCSYAAPYKNVGDAAVAARFVSHHERQAQENYQRFFELSHTFDPNTRALPVSAFAPDTAVAPIAYQIAAVQAPAAIAPPIVGSDEPPADFLVDEFDEMLSKLPLLGEDFEIQMQQPAAIAASPAVSLAPMAPDQVVVDTKATALTAITKGGETKKSSSSTGTKQASKAVTKGDEAKKSSSSSISMQASKAVGTKRARKLQTGQWEQRYKELLQFQSQHGHMFVPHSYPANQKLAQWTKRQRYQHKLKHSGHHSTLSDEREGILNKAGFIWDSHAASWQEQFQLLEQFSMTFGHCNVPTRYQGSATLNVWCKHQRKQYKLRKNGKPCTLNKERLECLDSIGFNWNPRSK